VIFIQPNNEPELFETGDNLGDMTSELGTSEFISKFASVGPKNYAYSVVTGPVEKQYVKYVE